MIQITGQNPYPNYIPGSGPANPADVARAQQGVNQAAGNLSDSITKYAIAQAREVFNNIQQPLVLLSSSTAFNPRGYDPFKTGQQTPTSSFDIKVDHLDPAQKQSVFQDLYQRLANQFNVSLTPNAIHVEYDPTGKNTQAAEKQTTQTQQQEQAQQEKQTKPGQELSGKTRSYLVLGIASIMFAVLLLAAKKKI